MMGFLFEFKIYSCSAVFHYAIYFLQDEIIFPTLVAASYLKEQNFKKKAYVLASSAMKEILKSNEIMFSNDVGVSILFLPFSILIFLSIL